MPDAPNKVRLAFNLKKRKPGCIIIQRAFGGDLDSFEFHRLFPAETWETGASDMQTFLVDREELPKIASRVRLEHGLDALPEQG